MAHHYDILFKVALAHRFDYRHNSAAHVLMALASLRPPQPLLGRIVSGVAQHEIGERLVRLTLEAPEIALMQIIDDLRLKPKFGGDNLSRLASPRKCARDHAFRREPFGD
jgi:hypothetical protein